MLAFKLDRTTCILEVEETLSSANKSTTHFFYYDLLKWMCSSNGLKGDVPDREMTPGAIDWVRRTYLPRVLGPVPKRKRPRGALP